MKTLPLLMSVVLLAALLHEGGVQAWGKRRHSAFRIRRRSANTAQCSGHPANPSNGNGWGGDGTVQFPICNFGYKRSGVRDCSNGEWTGTIPTCIPSCTSLNPANGAVSCSVVTMSSGTYERCDLTCDPFYSPSGLFTRTTCMGEPGAWMGTLSPCEKTCGNPAIAPNVDYSSRILDGDEAEPHSWPWMVSLREVDYGQVYHFCGGALVDSQWVVTSAICAEALERYRDEYNYGIHAVLGAHDLSGAGTQHDIADIIRHPESDVGANENNIALLKLAAPVTYNTNVHPVCLPSAGSPSLGAGTECVATGWGAKDMQDHDRQRTEAKLRQVVLPVSTKDDCHPDGGTLEPKTFCAGMNEGGKGFCYGDKGGPLVHEQNGKWTLVGVISSYQNYLCHFYTARGTTFTDVAVFRQWLEDTIHARS